MTQPPSTERMIIDHDISISPSPGHLPQRNSAQFATVMAQCTATPLFSPWPANEQYARANPVASSAALNTHPAKSNRREGRHARG